MPTILSTEYENQNSRRQYPFADNATLVDTDGKSLPTDFLIDAHLYPLDLTGTVYLSSIDTGTNTIYFADSVTRRVFGQAFYTAGATTADVYETGEYLRQVGVLVFGPGLSDVIRGGSVRTFTATATTLTPTAFTPINQLGVRGIRLPDGTLMTGNVTIEGRDGVRVTSHIVDDVNFLRIDVIGVPALDANECSNLGPPICTIVVERKAGSRFVPSKYDDYTLALTANGLSLDAICEAAKARRRPDSRDPCVTPLPPDTDADAGSADQFTYDICALGVGAFMVVAPSSMSYRNPISVRPIEGGVPAPNRMTVPPATSVDDATRLADKFRLPDSIAGGILIEFQGIGKGQSA